MVRMYNNCITNRMNMVSVDQSHVMHVVWPACGDLSARIQMSGVERAPEKNERENSKESSTEVTDVDAVGQEQEVASQEQAGQTEGQSNQQQGQEMRKQCYSSQAWRRGKEGPAQGGGGLV